MFFQLFSVLLYTNNPPPQSINAHIYSIDCIIDNVQMALVLVYYVRDPPSLDLCIFMGIRSFLLELLVKIIGQKTKRSDQM
jgi:hypothetical protein